MADTTPLKSVSPFEAGYVRDEAQLKTGLPLFETAVTLGIFGFWTVSSQ